MNLEDIKKLNIPKAPGCYFFLDENKKIIYIGKAANLKSRVLSYWQKSTSHTPAKYSMLKKIAKINWLETDSEIEALLLESNLIKKHQPQYNVVMRDDKRFVYIKISTEEDYPRVFMTRQISQSGRYFGPFTSTEAVKQTLKTIRQVWPYRSCRTMPKRACLYFKIKKCPAPCEKKIEKKEYRKIIKQIEIFLEGKRGKLEKDIKKDAINLKKGLKEVKNEDGKINLENKIARLNYQLINLKKVLDHSNILSLKNKYANDVLELAKVLRLSQIPERIEGYDISNIFGKMAVGSMVVFEEGEPNKNEYRKFKIKTEEEKGDIAMLKEILERRFKNKWPTPNLIIIDGGKAQLNIGIKILEKNKLDIPIISVSKGDGMRSSRAPDKIFFPGQSQALELPLASPALHIVKRVRDEAHRFAINYHRQLKRKEIRK